MSIAKIHGAEYPIRKIFSNDFVFRIPLYQRPYSWTTEQAGELLDDLLDFTGQGTTAVDDLSPYFLGSIVLIKQEHLPDAEIVDGQQRLTTLTILLSALRSLLTGEYAAGLTKYLYERGDKIEGNPNRYRLTLRDRDADFFRNHIQEDEQIDKLKGLDPRQLTDSRRNIRANAVLFLDRLKAFPDEQRVRLAQFIAKQCLLVVVTTPDLDSAYRIFSILNDRGMDLSHSDILKSEVIGKIPSDLQEAYNERWEDAEEELGREAFSDLFAHTRMIYRKAKPKESILKEFREFVVKRVGDSKALIDDVLIPFADAFAVIRTASYESTEGAERVNRLLSWLNRIDNFDWIPPALAFLARHKTRAQAVAPLPRRPRTARHLHDGPAVRDQRADRAVREGAGRIRPGRRHPRRGLADAVDRPRTQQVPRRVGRRRVPAGAESEALHPAQARLGPLGRECVLRLRGHLHRARAAAIAPERQPVVRMVPDPRASGQARPPAREPIAAQPARRIRRPATGSSLRRRSRILRRAASPRSP